MLISKDCLSSCSQAHCRPALDLTALQDPRAPSQTENPVKAEHAGRMLSIKLYFVCNRSLLYHPLLHPAPSIKVSCMYIKKWLALDSSTGMVAKLTLSKKSSSSRGQEQDSYEVVRKSEACQPWRWCQPSEASSRSGTVACTWRGTDKFFPQCWLL